MGLRCRSVAERGAILLLTLIFLLLLGIVSSAAMQAGTLQMKMALNEQLQIEAMQGARAIAQALEVIPANFRVDQPVGSVRCAVSSVESGCDIGGLELPPGPLLTLRTGLSYRVVRLGPEFVQLQSRRSELNGDPEESGPRFALFEIQVQLDGSLDGLGSAQAIRGVALRLSSAPEQQSHLTEADVPPGQIAQSLGVYWRYPQFDPL